MKTTLMAVLVLGMAGCEPDTSWVFGGAAGATATTTGSGGAGGGGMGGSATTSTTSITGTTSWTVTSSTTSTTSTDPCKEAACATTPVECGPVDYDCNGDGVNETYICGECDFPGACGGSEIPHQCGVKCLSKWNAQCSAVGLPSVWTMPSDCQDSYKFVAGQLLFCTGCAWLDCKKATFDDKEVLCCPSP